MKLVFISYRHGDVPTIAARLFGQLTVQLPKELGVQLPKGSIFWDVNPDSIPAGESITDVIKQQLADTPVLLAIIGPRWIDLLRNERLIKEKNNDHKDWVLEEIAVAHELGCRVIPVLAWDETMPKPDMPTADDLAHALGAADLWDIRAVELLGGAHFEGAFKALVAEMMPTLRRSLRGYKFLKRLKWRIAFFCLCATALGAITLALLYHSHAIETQKEKADKAYQELEIAKKEADETYRKLKDEEAQNKAAFDKLREERKSTGAALQRHQELLKDARENMRNALYDYNRELGKIPGTTALRIQLLKQVISQLERMKRHFTSENEVSTDLISAHILLGIIYEEEVQPVGGLMSPQELSRTEFTEAFRLAQKQVEGRRTPRAVWDLAECHLKLGDVYWGDCEQISGLLKKNTKDIRGPSKKEEKEFQDAAGKAQHHFQDAVQGFTELVKWYDDPERDSDKGITDKRVSSHFDLSIAHARIGSILIKKADWVVTTRSTVPEDLTEANTYLAMSLKELKRSGEEVKGLYEWMVKKSNALIPQALSAASPPDPSVVAEYAMTFLKLGEWEWAKARLGEWTAYREGKNKQEELAQADSHKKKASRYFQESQQILLSAKKDGIFESSDKKVSATLETLSVYLEDLDRWQIGSEERK